MSEDKPFTQPSFTPFQVRVFGVFVIIVVMIAYMVSVVFHVQSYSSDWYGFNSTQIQNCNQSTWNAIVTSGWSFSNQWITPLGDISNSLYGQCAKFTSQVRAEKGQFSLPANP